jgi:hypothetical protein
MECTLCLSHYLGEDEVPLGYCSEECYKVALRRAKNLAKSSKPPRSILIGTWDIAQGIRKRPLSFVRAAKQYIRENPEWFSEFGRG